MHHQLSNRLATECALEVIKLCVTFVRPSVLCYLLNQSPEFNQMLSDLHTKLGRTGAYSPDPHLHTTMGRRRKLPMLGDL